MNLRNFYITLFILLFSLSFFLLFTTSIFARRMTPFGVIHGNVRVNICGDYIADGPEHCDRTDLRGQTCKTLGFDGGELKCNLVCEFDMSKCVYTPIPPEEKKEDVVTEETEIVDIEEQRSQALEEFIRRYIPQAIVDPPSQTQLPSAVLFLRLFDVNNDGIIQSSELPLVVLNWVNAWKYGYETEGGVSVSCDLNNDGTCDLRDFSILMSYIDIDFGY